MSAMKLTPDTLSKAITTNNMADLEHYLAYVAQQQKTNPNAAKELLDQPFLSWRGKAVTPLMLAAISGNVEMVVKIIEAGANPRVQVGFEGATALSYAAWANKLDCVKELYAYELELDPKTGRTHINDSFSPAHAALALAGSNECAVYLEEQIMKQPSAYKELGEDISAAAKAAKEAAARKARDAAAETRRLAEKAVTEAGKFAADAKAELSEAATRARAASTKFTADTTAAVERAKQRGAQMLWGAPAAQSGTSKTSTATGREPLKEPLLPRSGGKKEEPKKGPPPPSAPEM